jgi:hypothetical protein
MNNKLITALRTAAKALEEDRFDYDWTIHERCNCGVVICALKGVSAKQLRKLFNNISREDEDKRMTWTDAVGRYCPITGSPTHTLFKELNSYGLTPKDIVELGNLSNPEVLAALAKTMKETRSRKVKEGFIFKRTRIETETVPIVPQKEEKLHLVAYLRAWADLLTEKGALDIPEKERVTETATV